MKKILVLFLALVALQTYGQRKEKIKGNKDVLIKKFTIPDFSEIQVGEKFVVELKKATDTTGVVIETDDNLFEVIHFGVEEGVLKFNTSKEIVKKKRLKITVYASEKLSVIKILKKGKVNIEDEMLFNNLKIFAEYRAECNMNIHVNNDLIINSTGKTELNFELHSKTIQLNLHENTEFEAKINAKDIVVDCNEHSTCKLEGNATNMVLNAKNKSSYSSKNFVVKNAEVRAFDKSDVYVNVSDNIVLKLSEQTEVYLYGSPKINLKRFKDDAVLYKK